MSFLRKKKPSDRMSPKDQRKVIEKGLQNYVAEPQSVQGPQITPGNTRASIQFSFNRRTFFAGLLRLLLALVVVLILAFLYVLIFHPEWLGI